MIHATRADIRRAAIGAIILCIAASWAALFRS